MVQWLGHYHDTLIQQYSPSYVTVKDIWYQSVLSNVILPIQTISVLSISVSLYNADSNFGWAIITQPNGWTSDPTRGSFLFHHTDNFEQIDARCIAITL